jgi:hypothetical protein
MPSEIEWLTEEEEVRKRARESSRPALIDFFKPG